MLRFLAKHRHFRTSDKAIIDPWEFDTAEEKLLPISQLESFPVESKQKAAENHVKKSSRISSYSPFIGPNGSVTFSDRI